MGEENRERRLRRKAPSGVAIFHVTEDTLTRVCMGLERAESAPRVATFFSGAQATHDTVLSDGLPEIVAWMNQ